MMRRLLMTAAATGCVFVSFLVYAQMSQTMLRREQNVRQKSNAQVINTVPFLGPKISQDVAERWLPDVPWAMSARAKIRADGMHLYFNQKRILNGGTEVEVSPVAIVWLGEEEEGSGKSPQEPIVVLAERATFLFDQAVELSEIRTRLIKEIMLRGTVTIRGEDQLSVKGSNFVFSRANRHLRSDYPIEFHFQNHFGFANNIQLNLEMRDDGPYADNPRIDALTDLLIRDHLEMTLVPDEQEPPLLVTCEGSLQYRFASHLATLDKDVLVYRTDPQGFVDSLNCDRLDLQFTKDPAVIAAAKSAGMNSGQIALKTITASGQEVLAKSSAYQMTAIGEKLIFDLPERRLTMIKNRGVELTFQDAEIFTPRFEVMLDEQGQLRQAECAGPGQIKYHELESTRTESPVSIPVVSTQANWHDKLVVMPDPETAGRLQKVILTGKAVLHSPKHRAGLLANQISMWLHVPESQQTLLPGQQPAAIVAVKPAGDSPGKTEKARLVRALSEGNVAVVSPYLEGEYQVLDLHFLEQSVRESEGAGAKPASSLVQAENFQSGDLISLKSEQQKTTQIHAEHLTLQILHEPGFKNPRISHAQTQGWVNASGQFADQKSPLKSVPFQLDGIDVQITDDGGASQKFELHGTAEKQATVQYADMRLDGLHLLVDRGADFSEVNGAGSLEFPVQSNFEGQTFSEARTMTISWKQKMRFEGDVARFYGDVRAELGDGVIVCQEMIVTLDHGVSLQGPTQGLKPRLARIECRHQVRFDLQQMENGKLIGVRTVQVDSFTLNHQTGALFAQGPGIMEFWQIRNGKQKMGLPEGLMKPTAGSTPDAAKGSPQWDYTQVTFAGEMNGNYIQQLATLRDRVNVLHGPVPKPLDRFVRDQRPPESVWLTCGVLEILAKKRVAGPDEVNPGETLWSAEIRAQENAEIEGDRFLARADLITYDHDTRMFSMRSLQNRHATIWHYANPQAPRARYDVKMIRVSPDGNVLELDRTLGASGSG